MKLLRGRRRVSKWTRAETTNQEVYEDKSKI
jgi:hypothetical protein